MKPEHSRLFNDLMAGSDAASQREVILQSGRRVLRRKRYARYATRILAAVACIGVGVLAVSRLTVPQPRVPAPAPKVASHPPAPPTSRVQVLTDDELLALFPGTPVGLAKVNGKQRLIFLRPEDEARFIVHL